MIKYILYPGVVKGVWLGPNTLCKLYGIDRDETITYADGGYWRQGCRYVPKEGMRLYKLTPREDGIYKLPGEVRDA